MNEEGSVEEKPCTIARAWQWPTSWEYVNKTCRTAQEQVLTLLCDALPVLQGHVAHQAGHDFPGVHAHLQPHAAAIWQRQAVAEVQQRLRQAHKRSCMPLIAILGARHKDQGVSCVQDAQALRCYTLY